MKGSSTIDSEKKHEVIHIPCQGSLKSHGSTLIIPDLGFFNIYYHREKN